MMLPMLGFLGGKVVPVAFLGDSGVGPLASDVAAFECFSDGAFTVLALRGGGKMPPGR